MYLQTVTNISVYCIYMYHEQSIASTRDSPVNFRSPTMLHFCHEPPLLQCHGFFEREKRGGDEIESHIHYFISWSQNYMVN